jgi:UDP-glucose 4-epimerase
MKILVAGGAGYVGSHFVRRAREKKNEIVVVDNLATGHRAAVPEDVKFYKTDIREVAEMTRILKAEKPDAVVHFAAFSLVGESMTEPLKYFDNNVYGMIALLEAMKNAGVKKIIFSSSAATYGVPETIPIKETDPQLPINPYGETKLEMEHIMAWADKAYGIKGVALRYFNVAGADASGEIGEDHNPETHLIPNILKAALGSGQKFTLFGDDYDTPDGTNVRDYVHPTDLADAHLLALDYLTKTGKSDAFNLGSATGFSNKEIFAAAEKIVGRPIEHEIGPRRPGDPDTLVADSTKARKILGWKPEYDSVEKIIGSAWRWHEAHPKGYENSKILAS